MWEPLRLTTQISAELLQSIWLVNSLGMCHGVHTNIMLSPGYSQSVTGNIRGHWSQTTSPNVILIQAEIFAQELPVGQPRPPQDYTIHKALPTNTHVSSYFTFGSALGKKVQAESDGAISKGSWMGIVNTQMDNQLGKIILSGIRYKSRDLSEFIESVWRKSIPSERNIM